MRDTIKPRNYQIIMNKVLLAVVSLLILMCMSGFVSKVEVLKMKDSKSGEFTFTVALKKQFQERFTSIKLQDVETKKPSNAWDILYKYIQKTQETAPKLGFTVVDIDDTNFKGFSAKKSFSSFEEMKNIVNVDKPGDNEDYDMIKKIMNSFQTTKNNEIALNVDLTSEYNNLKAQLDGLLQGGTFSQDDVTAYEHYFKIDLYDKPTSQNADTAEGGGKVLVWDMKKTIKMEMLIDMGSSGGAALWVGIIVVLLLVVGGVGGFIFLKKRAETSGTGGTGSIGGSGGSYSSPTQPEQPTKPADRWEL